MRIFKDANYPFLSWRRPAFAVVAVAMLITIGAMVRNAVDPNLGSWLNYGVDFTGGTIVQVEFHAPTDVEEIRAVEGAGGWEIYRYGAGDEFIIRMATFSQGTELDATEVVEETLADTFGEGTFSVVRTEAVGPKVGAELQQKAILAILISLGATLIYLAYRFEWRFGLAAVIGAAHVVIFSLGLLAVLRLEITLGTVAALLTILGYSLNDTIVVFDRIRENLAGPSRGQSFEEVVNRSLNETLPRTVLTGTSTLGTLIALLVFGGPVIFDFALVLIVGVLVGIFATLFIAAPSLQLIEQRWPRKSARGAGKTRPPARRESAAV